MIYARSGDKGHNVQSWQMALNKTHPAGAELLVEDGIFGSKTLAATIRKQKVLGVTPDGIVGDQTYKAFKAKYPFVAVSFITRYTPDAAYFDKKALERTPTIPAGRTRTPPVNPLVSDTPPSRKPGIIIPVAALVALMFMG
jgi:peptidoglycan hydrolase-like protein with peptidoglycan-binding domain